MGWLLVLLYYLTRRRRVRELDHAHDLPSGDRRPLVGQSPVDAWREWR